MTTRFYLRLLSFVLLTSFCLPDFALAQESGWPRTIQTAKALVTIYEPQPELLNGDVLQGRSAISVELDGDQDPIFGVVWFEAKLKRAENGRDLIVDGLKVADVRFPDQEESQLELLSKLIEREFPMTGLVIDQARLAASLELAELQSEAAGRLKFDPPTILVRYDPAILITIDGEPQKRAVENTKLERIINTPFTILFDPASSLYFLNADATVWYSARDLTGTWKVATNVPTAVRQLAPKVATETDAGADLAAPADGPPPTVIVATTPTELVSIIGPPNFKPVIDTDLLYLTNTDSDLLFDSVNQRYHLLLAGRWFTSASLNGPWAYEPGSELPEDFRNIPENSELGTVLYAVPGTDDAREAVLDAQIPQTARVPTGKASLIVTYDGPAQFEPIEGTVLRYAINTATPVLQFGNSYFAVEDAVWYVGGNPNGPWNVAASIPSEIYSIPPESPMYHVTFVRIYKATAAEVTVGYTSGYTNTYVYQTTVVYGTGYYYRPWYGSYYYPYHSTWGFHMRYIPCCGWGYGFSYGYGPYRFTIGGGGWYGGGFWGYHHGYSHGYHHGYRAGYRAGYYRGTRPELYRGQGRPGRDNIYRTPRNLDRNVKSADLARPVNRSATISDRSNNVYADRAGNVHRRTSEGWQQRTRDGWKTSDLGNRPSTRPGQGIGQGTGPRTADRITRPSTPTTRPSTPTTRPRSPSTSNIGSTTTRAGMQRPTTSISRASASSISTQNSLNRSYNARQRGNQRTMNRSSYSRPTSMPSRSGGASRSRMR